MNRTNVALVSGENGRLACKTNAISETSNQQDQLAAFYELLRVLHRGGTFMNYWTSDVGGKGGTTDWRRCDGNLRPKASWLDNKHLYFGVHPTNEIPTTSSNGEKRHPNQVRSRKSIIHGINGFFADIDAKDYVDEDEWKPFYVTPDIAGKTNRQIDDALKEARKNARDAAVKADLPKYKGRAYEHAINAPLKASALWDSGGGYQGIWLLASTFAINDDTIATFEHIQEQWVVKLGGDTGAKDLPRVLRVPGSWNHKSKYAPNFPMAKFLWCDTSIQYDINDFVALLPAIDKPVFVQRERLYVPEGIEYTPGDPNKLFELPRHPAIDELNKNASIRDLLLEVGYTPSGRDRYNRPGSNDSDSVLVYRDNSANVFSSQDPLYVDGRFSIKPAHVLLAYKYNYDIDAMMTDLTGVPWREAMFSEEMADKLLAWAYSDAINDWLRDNYDIKIPLTYVATLHALIQMAKENGSWLIQPGLRAIAERCNASHVTVRNHLTWLNGSMFQLWHSDKATYIDLAILPPTLGLTVSTSAIAPDKTVNPSVGVEFQMNTLAFDGFVPVAYTHGMRRRLAPRIGRKVVYAGHRKPSGLLTVGEAKIRRGNMLSGFATVLLPSLGRAGRPVFGTMMDADGDITRQEIAERTGISKRTIEKVTQQIERMGLAKVTVDAEGTKFYTLRDDAFDRLLSLMPESVSYKTGVRRQQQATAAQLMWVRRRIRHAAPSEREALERAEMRLSDKLDALLADLVSSGIKPGKVQEKPIERIVIDKEEQGAEDDALAAQLSEFAGDYSDKVRSALQAGYGKPVLTEDGRKVIDPSPIFRALRRPLKVKGLNDEDDAEFDVAIAAYAIAKAKFEDEARKLDWRSKYEQVIELSDDTFLAASKSGWVHVNAVGALVA